MALATPTNYVHLITYNYYAMKNKSPLGAETGTQFNERNTAGTRQLHASSTLATRQFHAIRPPVPRKFHADYTLATRQFHASSTPVPRLQHASSMQIPLLLPASSMPVPATLALLHAKPLQSLSSREALYLKVTLTRIPVRWVSTLRLIRTLRLSGFRLGGRAKKKLV